MKKLIENYFSEIKQTLDKILLRDIEKFASALYDVYLKGGHIFIMGNGGSASTASHFACDLSKGVLSPKNHKKIKRLKVTSLTDNMATITAWSNDLSYEKIFSEQLNNLSREGDAVIGISASGNSPNIIDAIKTAKKKKAITLGLAGFNGGKLAKMADICITAKVDKYDIAEDIHLMLSHIITRHFFNLINKKNYE
ncbi:SIS domain-containing protein [Patescibacteria group bacterium]|nr:SIS domain-containing protein [Patescibacteria group bacterium]